MPVLLLVHSTSTGLILDTPNSNSNSGGISNDAKLGVETSVPIGVVGIIVAIVGIVLTVKKRRKNRAITEIPLVNREAARRSQLNQPNGHT